MSDQETPGHSVNESGSVGTNVPPPELHSDSLPSIIIPEVLVTSIKNDIMNEILSKLSAKKRPASELPEAMAGPSSSKKRMDDAISLSAENYRLPEDTETQSSKDGDTSPPVHRSLPGDSSSVADNSEDNFSDLIKSHAKPISHRSGDLDISEEILLAVDSELPADVQYGPPIMENLAMRINNHFKEKSLKGDVKKTVMDRHQIPENCKIISPPKLQDSILGLKSFMDFAKRNERSLYNTQNMVAKATSAVTTMLNDILVADKESKLADIKKLVKNGLDAVTLLGSIQHELSGRRKHNIRPALNTQYHPLCNANRPTSEYLLGDDLQKGMKEAQEASKLAKSYPSTFTKSSNFKHYEKQYSKSGQNKKEKESKTSFLDRGKKPSSRFKRTSSRK